MRNGELLAIASGKVQGVGFRRAAKAIADRLGLKGFVRNLQDGSVEICAQGETALLELFLKSLQSQFPLGKIDASFGPSSQQRTDFKILP